MSEVDITFEKNGIHVDIEVDAQRHVALWNCSARHVSRGREGKWYPLVEVQCAGFNQNNHHGLKHSLTSPGSELRYEGHDLSRNAQGDVLSLTQSAQGLRATTVFQFYDGVKALRALREA